MQYLFPFKTAYFSQKNLGCKKTRVAQCSLPLWVKCWVHLALGQTLISLVQTKDLPLLCYSKVSQDLALPTISVSEHSTLSFITL